MAAEFRQEDLLRVLRGITEQEQYRLAIRKIFEEFFKSEKSRCWRRTEAGLGGKADYECTFDLNYRAIPYRCIRAYLYEEIVGGVRHPVLVLFERDNKDCLMRIGAEDGRVGELFEKVSGCKL